MEYVFIDREVVEAAVPAAKVRKVRGELDLYNVVLDGEVIGQIQNVNDIAWAMVHYRANDTAVRRVDDRLEHVADMVTPCVRGPRRHAVAVVVAEHLGAGCWEIPA